MDDHSELASFSLVRTRAMRIGTLFACVYFLLWAINSIIDPNQARHGLTFFKPDVFPWIARPVLPYLNIAFCVYLAWVCVALIRAMRCLEERLIVAAFAISLGLGVFADLPNLLAKTIANYCNLAVWTIAISAAARILVRYRNNGHEEPIGGPQHERGFWINAILYIGETFIATAGVEIIVLSALRLLYPTTHILLPSLTPESVIGLSYLPYSPFQIGVGFALGYWTALHFRSRSVIFVWILPMAMVVLYLCTYQPATVLENRWTAILALLGNRNNCRPPECYDQTFVVALYSAIAFSVGAWLRRRVGSKGGLSPTYSGESPTPE